MSTYGSPGPGPESGADPWPDETVPVAPAPPPTYTPTAYVPPATYPPAYQPGQAHYQPEPYQSYDDGWETAEPRRRNTAVIVLSILVAIVVLAGVGVGIYLVTGGNGTAEAKIPPVGDCVQSNGAPAPDTAMTIVTCTPGAYKVLAVHSGTDQISDCAGTPGLTSVFHFTSSRDISDSYVLCLGKS